MPLEGNVQIYAAYVRRSSEMQRENFSLDAQKRAITEEYARRGLPAPVFYVDDERSARGEQIAKRPAFKRLLEDVEAGRVRMIMVHSLDRWSRNVLVTLQSFRILSAHRVAFLSLSEHIDYSTPEGMLQLTIVAAFAAYYSDMLAKHTSKGKSERAAQGLPNGDIPFGYRSGGPKNSPEIDPETHPGLRMIGELRMQGLEADKIADVVNAAGYRTGSKRFGQRLFTKDTVNAILRNEFYAAFAPGDDRGTVLYKGQRFRGQHPATFTYEEWQQIRAVSETMHHAPLRASKARRVHEFAGYIACSHCGLPLRSQRAASRYDYYRDTAKARRLLPCSSGGNRGVKADWVRRQFGALLKSVALPEDWQELICQKLEEDEKGEEDKRKITDQEKERLKLKRARLVKLYKEGYIGEQEFRGEMAAVELTLRELEAREVRGVRLDHVLAAGEQLPGLATIWDAATTEERRQIVILLLEPGGLSYDLERKRIVGLRPRPPFVPLLLLLGEVVEYDEEKKIFLVKQDIY
jgi:site-specific DNA recombinase